jgi:Zn-dependent protease
MLGLLAHELAHCVAARRRGVEVHDIRLWLLGGVSSLEEAPPSARADFEIAIAGPATSVVLAALLFLFAVVLDALGVAPIVVAALFWLASINLVLAVFNLLPGAPLDGGRVLRAALWQRHGDRVRAAVSAARAGRGLGWSLAAAGVLLVLATGAAGGIWLALVGGFIVTAAQAEEAQIVVTHELRDVRIRDVMTSAPICAPYTATVDEVVHDYVLRHHCSAFPLVDDRGAVRALVTLSQLRQVAAGRRASVPAASVAVPVEFVTRAMPDEFVVPVLRRDTGTAGSRVLVFADEQLVGIVSPSDVTRALRSHEAALGLGRAA